MERLIDWTVDGIVTDYPNLLREVLGERAIPLPRHRIARSFQSGSGRQSRPAQRRRGLIREFVEPVHGLRFGRERLLDPCDVLGLLAREFS